MFRLLNLDIDVVWPIFCLLYVGMMLYTIGQALYQLYHIFEAPAPETKERRFDSVAMLPDLSKLHEQIEDQSFVPLGLQSVKFKSMPEPAYEWLYTNAESTIWIEAVQMSPEMPAMAQYTSIFEDGAMIMTRFPMGEVIDTPKFHAHYASNSLEAAHQYHLQKVKAWTRIHGAPCLVMSVDDVEEHNTVYRKQHRQLDLQKFVWGHSAQAVVALITALIMIYNMGALNNSTWLSIVMLFTGLGLGVVTFYVPRWIFSLRLFLYPSLDNRKAKPKPRARSIS